VREGAPDFRAFSLRTSDPVIAQRRGARPLSAITDLETRVEHDRHGQVTPDVGRIVRELVRKEAARIIADADVPTPDADGLIDALRDDLQALRAKLRQRSLTRVASHVETAAGAIDAVVTEPPPPAIARSAMSAMVKVRQAELDGHELGVVVDRRAARRDILQKQAQFLVGALHTSQIPKRDIDRRVPICREDPVRTAACSAERTLESSRAKVGVPEGFSMRAAARRVRPGGGGPR
jgi:hypothetical protein